MPHNRSSPIASTAPLPARGAPRHSPSLCRCVAVTCNTRCMPAAVPSCARSLSHKARRTPAVFKPPPTHTHRHRSTRAARSPNTASTHQKWCPSRSTWQRNAQHHTHNICTHTHAQVNTSGEESKYGVEPSEVVPLAKHVAESCPNLKLAGLMTIGMPDYTSRPENFDCLAKCRCALDSACRV